MAILKTLAGDGQVYIDNLSPTGSESTEKFNTYYDFFADNPLPEYARFLSETSTASDVHSAQVFVRIGDTGERIDLNAIADTSFASNTDTKAISNPFTLAQNSQQLTVNLTQTLTDLENEDQRIGAQLTQAYTFTNPSDTEVYLEFFRYADIDVNGSGSLDDDGGGRRIIDGLDWIFETDTTVAPDVETELIAIRMEGGSDLLGAYGFDAYDEETDSNPLSAYIQSGADLSNTVLGDGADEDELVDIGNGNDLALARGKSIRIAPGESESLLLFSVYGKLALDQLSEVSSTTPVLTPSSTGLLAVDNSVRDANIKFSLDPSSRRQVTEITAVMTDDENGTINGVSQGSEGYAEARLSRSETIFSVIPDSQRLSFDIERVLNVPKEKSISFDFLQKGDRTTVDEQSVLYEQLDDGRYQLSYRLPQGSGEFDEIKLIAALDNFERPTGAQLQGKGAQSELLDLRDVTADTVEVTFEVYREAAQDGFVGFYTIENETGLIFNENDELLYPGDEGYQQAAIRNRIDVMLSAENGQNATYTAEIASKQLLASFFVRDNSLDKLLNESTSDDPTVFFTHFGANSDGVDHVQLLGDNTFGFEDTSGGGDLDFNDLVVKATFA